MNSKLVGRGISAAAVAVISFSLSLPALANGTLRIGAGVERISNSASLGNDTVSVGESGFGGELLYQHESGVFGGAALIRQKADTLTINDDVYSVEGDPYKVYELDAGYRIPYTNTAGKYWGIGYRNTRYEDYDGTDNAFGIFWEKDQDARYGVIRAGLMNSDDLSMLEIEGKHLWFGGGPGFGLTWSFGSGNYDDGTNHTLFKLGGILMFRTGG